MIMGINVSFRVPNMPVKGQKGYSWYPYIRAKFNPLVNDLSPSSQFKPLIIILIVIKLTITHCYQVLINFNQHRTQPAINHHDIQNTTMKQTTLLDEYFGQSSNANAPLDPAQYNTRIVETAKAEVISLIARGDIDIGQKGCTIFKHRTGVDILILVCVYVYLICICICMCMYMMYV